MTLIAFSDMPASDGASSDALARLEASIRRHQRLVVAFSGGVDSAVLLAAAHRVLGARAVAVTADSPSMARAELDEAIRFTTQLGIEHRIVRTNEMERPEYVRNQPDRCFFCKDTLFQLTTRISEEAGGATVAYGYTSDDVGDYRPGHQAAKNHAVVAPLFEAGLGKNEIRAIAKALDLDVWDKPAAPCLSSRIPYGSAVTPEKLAAIERMEGLLHELGFRICRARYDGQTMRIEVEAEAISRVASEEILPRLTTLASELGVEMLEIDPEGFVSGKLNRSRA